MPTPISATAAAAGTPHSATSTTTPERAAAARAGRSDCNFSDYIRCTHTGRPTTFSSLKGPRRYRRQTGTGDRGTPARAARELPLTRADQPISEPTNLSQPHSQLSQRIHIQIDTLASSRVRGTQYRALQAGITELLAAETTLTLSMSLKTTKAARGKAQHTSLHRRPTAPAQIGHSHRGYQQLLPGSGGTKRLSCQFRTHPDTETGSEQAEGKRNQPFRRFHRAPDSVLGPPYI